MLNYELRGDVACLTLDDGKVNAIGHDMIKHINDALDKAENEAKAVLIIGRENMLSGGFDLKEFKKGPEATTALVRNGFQMLTRMYGFPLPLVTACTGHAVALGAFLLLASDTRIGTHGDFKITLPETAISMEVPAALMTLCVSRLTTQHLTRAAIQAEVYTPEGAVEAGFYDEVTDLDNLVEHALGVAQRLAQLPTEFYGRNKLLARNDLLATMQNNVDEISAQLEATA